MYETATPSLTLKTATSSLTLKMSETGEDVELTADQKLDIILTRTCKIDETLTAIGVRLDTIEQDTKSLAHKLKVETDDRIALATEVLETRIRIRIRINLFWQTSMQFTTKTKQSTATSKNTVPN